MVVLLFSASLCLLVTATVVWIATTRTLAVGDDSFRCRPRVAAGDVAGFGLTFPRRWQRGFWIHDVLFIRRGRLLPRLRALAVQSAQLSPLSSDLLLLRLDLDDGAVMLVEAERQTMTSVVGPFLLAELKYLDRA